MTIAALAPSGQGSSDGLAYDLKAKVDELIAAANSAGLFDQQPALTDIKPTVNTTAISAHAAAAAITAHTPATAIAATYADEAAARTSVNALRTDVEAALTVHDTDLTTLRTNVETALSAHDTALTTLRAEVEARLDAIETKLDAVIGTLLAAGVTA